MKGRESFMLQNPLKFSHSLLKNSIVPGDCVIDATVGNGNDTVLLAQLVGQTGKVYGFDIQKEAIEATEEKLLLTGQLPQTELIHAGHENIADYIPDEQNISAVVFNLGYLPSGDKEIITTPDTTIPAIEQSLTRLRRGGLVSLMVYHGHEGGKEEKEQVDSFVRQLSQEDYHVLEYKFVNQKNNPPFLYIIEKR